MRTKNARIMLLLKFSVYGSRKWELIKEQEASGLLSILGMRTPSR